MKNPITLLDDELKIQAAKIKETLPEKKFKNLMASSSGLGKLSVVIINNPYDITSPFEYLTAAGLFCYSLLDVVQTAVYYLTPNKKSFKKNLIPLIQDIQNSTRVTYLIASNAFLIDGISYLFGEGNYFRGMTSLIVGVAMNGTTFSSYLKAADDEGLKDRRILKESDLERILSN